MWCFKIGLMEKAPRQDERTVSAPRHTFSAEGSVQRAHRNGTVEGQTVGKFCRSLQAKRAHLDPKHLARRVSGQAVAGAAERWPVLQLLDGTKTAAPQGCHGGARGMFPQPWAQQQLWADVVTPSVPKYSVRANTHLSNPQYILPVVCFLLFAITAGQRAGHYSGSACFWSVLTLDWDAFSSSSLSGSHFVCSSLRKDLERSPICDGGFPVLSQQATAQPLLQFHNQRWAQYLRLARLFPGVSADRPDPPGPLSPEKGRGKL